MAFEPGSSIVRNTYSRGYIRANYAPD